MALLHSTTLSCGCAWRRWKGVISVMVGVGMERRLSASPIAGCNGLSSLRGTARRCAHCSPCSTSYEKGGDQRTRCPGWFEVKAAPRVLQHQQEEEE